MVDFRDEILWQIFGMRFYGRFSRRDFKVDLRYGSLRDFMDFLGKFTS